MAAVTASVGYRFGHFELQPDERRLLAGGHLVHLGAHAFDLLVALVERSGHLVTKDDLLGRVWGRVIVEENTLQSHISALRKVLGREAITTVSGRGYRFALEVTRFSATATAATPNHNLPHFLASFIGREKEIAELSQLLGNARLLTLTGAGGCGKTRLAIVLAKQQVHAYPDGAWLVELAALTDAGLLPQAVATVLGIKERAGARLLDTLAEYLASRALLLVLDNAEHLIEACAQLSESLLQRCPRLVILVTSRERIGITGEQTYRVPSLSVPDEESDTTPESIAAHESTRLFIERARLQQPQFAITARNAGAIASICRRLDGIALAIELAVPGIRTLSLEELSRRLDRCFEALSDGSRTALPRHRTLRSLIDWSYELLRDDEKTMLQHVSVFAGGWTLDAAEEVCANDVVGKNEVRGLLSSLVDKSLVASEHGDPQTRCRLLETVRQYARDRLEETNGSSAVRVRHRDYYLSLAEEADPKLRGAEQAEWLRRLEDEHENLRAGLEWSLVEAGSKGGLRLCGALQRFWWTRGHLTEGRQWCTRVLCKAGAEKRTRERAYVLNAAGVLSFDQSDYPAARALHEESLAIRRELGDRSGIAASLNNLGSVVHNQGDYPAARALHEEGLAIRRELGDRSGIASALNNLGNVAVNQGDYPGAMALYEESLAICRELGNQFGIAASLENLGNVALDQGDYSAARALLEECLAIRRELGDRSGIPSSLEGLAAVVASLRDSLRAARIWGATERSRAEIGKPLTPSERSRYDRWVVAARSASGDGTAFDSARQEGRSLTLDQAIDLALAKPVEGG